MTRGSICRLQMKFPNVHLRPLPSSLSSSCFLCRVRARLSVRGQPPRRLHLARGRAPPAQKAPQIPRPARRFTRRGRRQRDAPLSVTWLGSGLPHGAEGGFARSYRAWLHHPGSGRERHQKLAKLPRGRALLLPGVPEVDGQHLSGSVHVYGNGECAQGKCFRREGGSRRARCGLVCIRAPS